MDHEHAPRSPADHSTNLPDSETRGESLSALLSGAYPFRSSQDPARVSADLDDLRAHCMGELLKDLTQEPAVTLLPYVVAAPGAKRRDALEQLRRCVSQKPGWRLAEHSFSDTGAHLSSEQRHGLAAACRDAVIGPAHGLLVVGRSALPLDNREYERIIRYLHRYQRFVAFASQLAER